MKQGARERKEKLKDTYILSSSMLNKGLGYGTLG